MRLACRLRNNTTQYAAVPELLGTFNWRRVEADLTVHEDTVSLAIEVGLNGSTGTMWIDDVQVRPIPSHTQGSRSR